MLNLHLRWGALGVARLLTTFELEFEKFDIILPSLDMFVYDHQNYSTCSTVLVSKIHIVQKVCLLLAGGNNVLKIWYRYCSAAS